MLRETGVVSFRFLFLGRGTDMKLGRVRTTLGDVDGDSAALETDTGAEDEAAGENHAEVNGTCFEACADGV